MVQQHLQCFKVLIKIGLFLIKMDFFPLGRKYLKFNISTSWMSFWMIQVVLGRFEGPLEVFEVIFLMGPSRNLSEFSKRASVAISRRRDTAPQRVKHSLWQLQQAFNRSAKEFKSNASVEAKSLNISSNFLNETLWASSLFNIRETFKRVLNKLIPSHMT